MTCGGASMLKAAVVLMTLACLLGGVAGLVIPEIAVERPLQANLKNIAFWVNETSGEVAGAGMFRYLLGYLECDYDLQCTQTTVSTTNAFFWDTMVGPSSASARFCGAGWGGGYSGPFVHCANVEEPRDLLQHTFASRWTPQDVFVNTRTGDGIAICQEGNVLLCASGTCAEHVISGGTAAEFSFVRGVYEESTDKVYIAAQNGADENRVYVWICTPDMVSCESRSIASALGAESGHTPAIRVDAAAGTVYVATAHAGLNSTLWLHQCNMTGEACESKMLVADVQYWAEFSMVLAGDGIYFAGMKSQVDEAEVLRVAACPLSDLDGCHALDGLSLVTTLRHPPGLAVNPILDRIYIKFGDDAAYVVSPHVPPGCPRLIDRHQHPAGPWFYEYVHPDWRATHYGSCEEGYTFSGNSTRVCTSGSTEWTLGPGSCVFNLTGTASPVVDRTAVVDNSVRFRVDTAFPAATSVDGVGVSEVTAQVRHHGVGEPVAVRLVEGNVRAGTYVLFVTLSTLSGRHKYEIMFDGEIWYELWMVGTPDVFHAGFNSTAVSSDGRFNQNVVFAEDFRVLVPVQDRHANPLTADTPEALAERFSAALVTDGVRTPQIIGVLGNGARNADDLVVLEVTVTPRDVQDVTFLMSYAYEGYSYSIPCASCNTSATTFPLTLACPDGWVPTGTTCERLACLVNSKDIAAGNTTSADCVCERGFTFSERDENNLPVCVACPEGAVCAEGLEGPLPDTGYFPMEDGTFVRCHRPSSCSGGDGVCATGYEGYMCNRCSEGFYSDSSGDCVVCPESATGLMVGVFLLLSVAGVGGAIGIALLTVRHSVVPPAPSKGGEGEEAGEVLWSTGGYEETSGGLMSEMSESLAFFAEAQEEVDSSETDELVSLVGAVGGGVGFGARKSDRVPVERKLRRIPHSLGMVAITFQVVGIISTARMEWSSSAKSVLGVFQYANIDTNLFASECSLSSFHAKYVVSVMVPLSLIGLTVVTLGVVKGLSLLPLGGVSLRGLVDSVVFAFAPLLYIPISKAAFVLFDCTQLPNKEWVLDVDPGVGCFDGAWWRVFPVGLCVVLSFTMGIPVYFFVTIFRRRHKLFTDPTFTRYGALYNLFRAPYYLSGILELFKRLGVVATAVFVSDHVLAQLGLLFALFFLSIWHMTSVQPYFYPIYNGIDTRLTGALLFLLMLGTASYAERGVENESKVLVGLVVLFVVVLVAVAVHAVIADTLQIIRARRDQYSVRDHRMKLWVKSMQREQQDLGDARKKETDLFLEDLLHSPAPLGSTDTEESVSELGASESTSPYEPTSPCEPTSPYEPTSEATSEATSDLTSDVSSS